MFKQNIVLSVILALCFSQAADAIKCYQCKSLGDPACVADKLDANTKVPQVDCNINPLPNSNERIKEVTKCMKVTAKDAAGPIIIRDCHYVTINQKPDECYVATNLKVEHCDTCTGDLCNASSAGRFISMGIAAIFAVVAANLAL